MIRITARMNGFRRCGVAHYGVRDYPDDHWTGDQLAVLEADPMLVIERIEDAPSPAPETGKDAIASREAEQAGVSPAPRLCKEDPENPAPAPEAEKPKAGAKAKKK